MHPYAPPRAPLLRPDPVLELRRAARAIGLGAVGGVVALATVAAAETLGPDLRFLAAHGLGALAALLPVGLLGGPYVAFRGTGGWRRWAGAVLRVGAVGLASAVLGVALAGQGLRHLGHPQPFGGLRWTDLGASLWLGLGCLCLALAWAGLAGVVLRLLAQRWASTWAPAPEDAADPPAGP